LIVLPTRSSDSNPKGLDDCGEEEAAVEEEESGDEVASESVTEKRGRKRKGTAKDRGEDITRKEAVMEPVTQKRGRNRSSRDKGKGGYDGNPKGRKRPRTVVSAEGSENSSTNDIINNNTEETNSNNSGNSNKGNGRRRRRGTVYFTGVLTSSEGAKWLEEFEKHDLQPAEDKDESNKPSTVAVNTTQGSLVVENKVDKNQEELADATDYVTVLGSLAEQYFTPSEDCSPFF